jgi:hypothetical protein
MKKITAIEARNIRAEKVDTDVILEDTYSRIRQSAEAGNWFLYPRLQVPGFSDLSNSEKHIVLSSIEADGFEICDAYDSQCCIKW